ncbi:SDR family oxidoreductase [Minwuia sp.]|uniref:SDR family oxidoreductase n=1 Tax=Minwuia sp. TaxID=2493630 RepID=UPI003A90853E
MTEQAREGVLITGAAVRIGRAIALRLAKDGYPVAIHYNGSRDAARATVEDIRARGGRAAVVQCDLADHDAVLGLVPEAGKALDTPICTLINNASLFENDRLQNATRESFDRHMAINLRAPLFLAQQFAGALPETLTGNIINLIDMRVWKPTPGFISYTLSKAALEMLTRTLAMELAPRIRVNAIGPGPVLPNERQSDEQFEKQWKSTPLERGAYPGEIAEGVRFLMNAPSMTGQMIALDGGQHLPWPPVSRQEAALDG